MKEPTAYAKEKADSEANIAALGKAIAAIESGRAGSFIQTPAAKLLEARAAVEGDLAMTEKGLADSKYSLESAEQNCASPPCGMVWCKLGLQG